jgi:very-short-patch-repair endonuclease
VTEAKRATRQAKLCDCEWNAPQAEVCMRTDCDGKDCPDTPNVWHTKLSSCPSVPELQFWRLVQAAGLPPPEREYRFHPVRRWRFDYAWKQQQLAVEIEGGTWQGGRHSRGAGYQQDAEKGNTALSMGWKLLRYTPGMLKDTDLVATQVRLLLEP